MPRKKYQDLKIQDKTREMIVKANEIIAEYESKGFSLTLRSLYYKMFAREMFPDSWADKKTGSTNNQQSYDKLGVIINNARLLGLLDWTALEDITRGLNGNMHFENPADRIEYSSRAYRIDRWQDQEYRVEVWVEKDAMKGVIGPSATDLDISYFCCRGYTSSTALWDAGQRLKAFRKSGQVPVILHLGDHDPSGIDMSRDIESRVKMFMDGYGESLIFERIALNRDQVDKYKLPPNPAKQTDCRFEAYRAEHGEESWELDAIDPELIDSLIRDSIAPYLDQEKWDARESEEATGRKLLVKAAERWTDDIVPILMDE